MSCKHPALFKSMCVTCGLIIKPDENSSLKNVSSLTMHGGAALQVTSQEAEAIQANKLSKLRDLKKIALVLDLDHTLLHAVQIDGPFGSPSRREFADEVHHLPIEEVVNGNVKHLVMKKRPFLDEFLKQANEICQMTIYTAGTRRYAEAVAKIIDPDHKYFSNRIVSRSDNPNIKADAHDKSLERIFLKDSSMAVIIDDREDVWRANNDLQQLLLVRPYIYFTPYNTNSSVIEANNSSGPLSSTATSGSGNTNVISPVIALSRHGTSPVGCVLKTVPQFSSEFSESDDQLNRCLELVRDIHAKYYATTSTSEVGGNTNDLNASTSSSSSNNGFVANGLKSSFNNVCDILTTMKTSVLAGCTVTFSGIIPTNDLSPQNHVLYKLAQSLGAQVSLDLLPRTTHLIALNINTNKAIECLKDRKHNVWIVHPDWLFYSRWSLSRVLEVTFMLNAMQVGDEFPVVEMNTAPLTPIISRRPDSNGNNYVGIKSNDRLSSGSLSESNRPRAPSYDLATSATSSMFDGSNSVDNLRNSRQSDDRPAAVDPRLAKRQRVEEISNNIQQSTSSQSLRSNRGSTSSLNSSCGRVAVIPINNDGNEEDSDYDFSEIEDDEREDGEVFEEYSGLPLQFNQHPIHLQPLQLQHVNALRIPSETEGWVASDVDDEVDGEEESESDDDDYSAFESIVVQAARGSSTDSS